MTTNRQTTTMKAVGKPFIVSTAKLIIQCYEEGNDEQFDIAEIMMRQMLERRETVRLSNQLARLRS